ncbi:hypothetical protein L3Q72_23095 [Vibrio sp. JC009]|uniref:hypothetical protein n=1 Tax=Vibrio sp. JC009 TaxID=2912314 RepID=UPI0023B0A8BF|nr:hypothetical protein [Vibrio sp. JC009]WED24119.1 hypothetical protein L3Q72_23095 [Vibrio sp. JC009]
MLSKLPASYLQSRIHGEFAHIPEGHDFGMLMHSPIRVNVEASSSNYLQLLKEWDSCVESEKRCLADIKPDLLISNISPVSLAAAKSLGIKTASVAPFNWAQIYQAYCLDEQNPQSQQMYQRMNHVYSNVDYIFKPMPSVPDISHREIHIASIASQPDRPPLSLLATNKLDAQKNILFALGGFPMPMALSQLPEMAGWQWLVDQKVSEQRSDLRHIAGLSLSFLQLLASSDVIITKPGYGSYCEIAALAKHKKVRVLSLTRPDWPETPYLNAFLKERVPFMEIDLSDLANGRLAKLIRKLSELPYPETLPCEDGAEHLVNHLQREFHFMTPKSYSES